MRRLAIKAVAAESERGRRSVFWRAAGWGQVVRQTDGVKAAELVPKNHKWNQVVRL